RVLVVYKPGSVRHDTKNNQERIIGRKYAQGSPRVEAAKIIRTTFCIKQYSGDQKSGKNKKDIYSCPSRERGSHKPTGNSRKILRRMGKAKTVKEQHQQNCNSTDRVQFGHLRTNERVPRAAVLKSHKFEHYLRALYGSSHTSNKAARRP